jgi:hypothetical protein
MMIVDTFHLYDRAYATLKMNRFDSSSEITLRSRGATALNRFMSHDGKRMSASPATIVGCDRRSPQMKIYRTDEPSVSIIEEESVSVSPSASRSRRCNAPLFQNSCRAGTRTTLARRLLRAKRYDSLTVAVGTRPAPRSNAYGRRRCRTEARPTPLEHGIVANFRFPLRARSTKLDKL